MYLLERSYTITYDSCRDRDCGRFLETAELVIRTMVAY